MLSAENWAMEQWSSVELGDARRRCRALRLGAALAGSTDLGLPKQTGNWGNLKAAYRLLSHQQVTHEALQTPHWHRVRKIAREHEVVLFVQDTTELDYTRHAAVEGLGPIGNGRGKGLLVHSCVALTPEQHWLGVAYQQVWSRGQVAYKTHETRYQRYARRNKESEVWGNTIQVIGPAPSGTCWISVGDRGSDIFGYWQQAIQAGWQCLLRVFIDRRIEVDGLTSRLMSHARKLPAQAHFALPLRARPGQAARTANMHLAWSPIQVEPPRNDPASKARAPFAASLVRVWEATQKGLEWVLLATWPVHSKQEAMQCVDWYRLRWTIEEYHKCLKTGCKIEAAQLKSAHRLKALLGFTGIIAARLLQTSKVADDQPDLLACQVFDHDACVVLAKRAGVAPHQLSTSQFRLELAKMGGFIARKSDSKPGWQTLWRGWKDLQQILIGFHLAKCG